MLQGSLVRDVERAALLQNDLGARYLSLEITESLLMYMVAEIKAHVAHLSGLGVKLWLDNFGTGYASLNYLKRFPASAVKVERSFIRD